MTADRLSELEARIACLEAEKRRLRLTSVVAWLALIALIALGGLGAVYAQGGGASGAIEAREFIVRDESGHMVFYVGPEGDGAVLFLRNREGRVTARLPWTKDIVLAAH